MSSVSPNPLLETVRDFLSKGPMPASDFMSLALYHPEHGYYRRGQGQWGFDGKDYYTALDLGPLLGETVACALYKAWLDLDRPVRFTVLEPGAGRGWLGRDILNAATGDFAESLQYIHCDDNPAARHEASKALRQWLESGKAKIVGQSDKVEAFAGAVVSNELFDALPAQPWRWEGGRWEREELVSLRGENDGEASWGAFDPGEAGAWFGCHAEGGLYDGDGSVWAESLPQVLDDICRPLEKGLFLAIDYGDGASRLIAKGAGIRRFARHRVDSRWWELPGKSDLTADADFTRLAHILSCLGIRAGKPVTLSKWIRENAPLAEWERQWQGMPQGERAARSQNLLHLTLPSEMGDRFKVLQAVR